MSLPDELTIDLERRVGMEVTRRLPLMRIPLRNTNGLTHGVYDKISRWSSRLPLIITCCSSQTKLKGSITLIQQYLLILSVMTSAQKLLNTYKDCPYFRRRMAIQRA